MNSPALADAINEARAALGSPADTERLWARVQARLEAEAQTNARTQGNR